MKLWLEVMILMSEALDSLVGTLTLIYMGWDICEHWSIVGIGP